MQQLMLLQASVDLEKASILHDFQLLRGENQELFRKLLLQETALAQTKEQVCILEAMRIFVSTSTIAHLGGVDAAAIQACHSSTCFLKAITFYRTSQFLSTGQHCEWASEIVLDSYALEVQEQAVMLPITGCRQAKST